MRILDPAESAVRDAGHRLRMPQQFRLIVCDGVVERLLCERERGVCAFLGQSYGGLSGQGFGDTGLVADAAANLERPLEESP